VLTKKVHTLKEVRVADIKASFPFDHSQYHFRFQTKMSNMKVWIDTSKDAVAVPNIDGVVKIKLLKLPKGIADKYLAGPPPVKSHGGQPVLEKKQQKAPAPQREYLSPTKGKGIHHVNSQNNIADKHMEINKPLNHKPSLSHQDRGEDFMDNTDHYTPNDNSNDEMDFNIDTDELFGGPAAPKQTQNRQSDQDNLLGDFETNNINNAPQPDAQTEDIFDLAGGLGDLDFNASNEPKEESKKSESAPLDIRQHVKDINQAELQEREDWQKAFAKHDNRIKIWKGVQQPNSIKILL
jgi:hypothetical protein